MTSNPAICEQGYSKREFNSLLIENGPDVIAFSDRDYMWVTSDSPERLSSRIQRMTTKRLSRFIETVRHSKTR